jgi:hypothetical protein
MLDASRIGVLSQSLARISNTRFFFLYHNILALARRWRGAAAAELLLLGSRRVEVEE